MGLVDDRYYVLFMFVELIELSTQYPLQVLFTGWL